MHIKHITTQYETVPSNIENLMIPWKVSKCTLENSSNCHYGPSKDIYNSVVKITIFVTNDIKNVKKLNVRSTSMRWHLNDTRTKRKIGPHMVFNITDVFKQYALSSSLEKNWQ